MEMLALILANPPAMLPIPPGTYDQDGLMHSRRAQEGDLKCHGEEGV